MKKFLLLSIYFLFSTVFYGAAYNIEFSDWSGLGGGDKGELFPAKRFEPKKKKSQVTKEMKKRSGEDVFILPALSINGGTSVAHSSSGSPTRNSLRTQMGSEQKSFSFNSHRGTDDLELNSRRSNSTASKLNDSFWSEVDEPSKNGMKESDIENLAPTFYRVILLDGSETTADKDSLRFLQENGMVKSVKAIETNDPSMRKKSSVFSHYGRDFDLTPSLMHRRWSSALEPIKRKSVNGSVLSSLHSTPQGSGSMKQKPSLLPKSQSLPHDYDEKGRNRTGSEVAEKLDFLQDDTSISRPVVHKNGNNGAHSVAAHRRFMGALKHKDSIEDLSKIRD